MTGQVFVPQGDISIAKISNASMYRRIHDLLLGCASRMTFDYIEGGCDDKRALTESGAAFDTNRLLPRYLVDVSRLDTTVSIAGQTFSMPVGIAPTGNAGMLRHDADRLLAAEAAAANVPFVLSGASNASIEEAMKVAPDHTSPGNSWNAFANAGGASCL